MTEVYTAAPTGYRKRFYKLGEVCTLTGLEGHVLRYWEAEFEQLQPRKSRGGQRLYSPEDIELVQRIRDLVHVQGFTIAGARRRLELGDEVDAAEGGGARAAEALEHARQEIRAILTLLDANDKL